MNLHQHACTLGREYMSEKPKGKIRGQAINAAGIISTGNEESLFLNVLMGKILITHVLYGLWVFFSLYLW